MTEYVLYGDIPLLFDKYGDPVTLSICTTDPDMEVTACFGDGGVLVELKVDLVVV